jgi:hypothetical protein
VAVAIELAGQLEKHRGRRLSLVLPGPMSVRDVALHLGLNPEEIGLIAIDGRQSELDDLVPASCRLGLYPPVSGG